jgi:SAM-dependent methyltransferase
MSKINHTACPICRSVHIKPFLTCTDNYATGEAFEVFRCDDCGFTFTQDAPSSDEIGRYYASAAYISHSDTRKGLMNTVYHWVRGLMLNRKARLIEKESGLHTGTLLDVGTGTGYFPHQMKERGWNVEAIEKNAQARDFASAHFDLHVRDDSSWHALEDRSFDVVTLWHVMEHLENLDATWDELNRILKDSGVLVIAVPNCASYDASVYRQNWAAYDVPRHLWHFTPSTIRPLAQRHGFTLSKEYPMPFDAYYVSMLGEKEMKHSLSFVRGLWTGFVAQLHCIGNKEKSSSMIYIFRKAK